MWRAEAQRGSSLASLGIIPAQILFIACALVMGGWVAIPWPGLIAIGVCGASSIIAATAAANEKQSLLRSAFVVTAIGGLVAPLGLLLPSRQPQTLDAYHAAIAWLMAAVVFAPALLSRNPVAGKQWKQLSILWGLLGSAIWLFTSYEQNLPGAFYFGLAFNIVLLLSVKACFKMSLVAIQAVNTLILILAGLPLADLAMGLTHRLDLRPETGKRYYSYEVARRKPAAFATWWKYYNQQWELMARKNFMRDPSGQLPLRLRPNSRGEFFQSQICINSKGFRGREFSNEKGATYRIVALGESTTFGCTLNAGDKPWPEVLEEAIRDRLKLSGPIEVINAGVPGYTLVHNLARLNSDILPLKPDMIISYHGYNGLDLLSSPSPHRDAPLPVYCSRPLKLLADAEHGLRIMSYKRRMTAQKNNSQTFADPTQSPYAAAYRQLIEFARSNSVTLVIGNFSMAANMRSEPGVIDFYRAGYPLAASRVKANAAHSLMVRQLVKENPDTYFVDTHPSLDGEHEKFIDLVHFTQEGRHQLAEIFFAGITNILIERLATSDSKRLSKDAH